jgi:serine acetyltransferase
MIRRTLRLGSNPIRYFRSQGVEIGGRRIVRSELPGAYLYWRMHVADNRFIGAHSVFLPGAKVGAGSVIGSGSIVTGEIPAGVVAVGAPAKPVKSAADYVKAKRYLWVDTEGLTPSAKRELLINRLPK